MKTVLYIVVAYGLGSIPFGLLTGWWAKGIDIREHDSKNISATNVFRTVGKKWGILVFALDAFKGAGACLFPVLAGEQMLSVPMKLLLGVFAIVGHTFPVWLRFKGGKGVATSLGVFLAICWQPTLIAFGLWVLVFLVTHIISLSSLAAALAFPVIITCAYLGSSDLKWLLPISLFLAAFIFYTHRSNIQRLLRGNEKRLF